MAKSLRRLRAGRGTFVLLLLSLLTSIPVWGQVKVWEGVLKLPTYEEGSPDPNPPFDQFSTGRFNYPYTLRNEITNTRAEHEWRAVYLENESFRSRKWLLSTSRSKLAANPKRWKLHPVPRCSRRPLQR